MVVAGLRAISGFPFQMLTLPYESCSFMVLSFCVSKPPPREPNSSCAALKSESSTNLHST